MRTTILAIAVALATMIGCGPESKSKTEGDAGGVEVNAPGVDVKVKPGEGVEVEAPGVDVDAKRTDEGGEVNVHPK
jgi:hypothetical protein